MRGVRELAVGTGRRAHEWSRKCAHDVRPVLELGSGPLVFFSPLACFPFHLSCPFLSTSSGILWTHRQLSPFRMCLPHSLVLVSFFFSSD